MNKQELMEALEWAKRNEHAFDLQEYASNDIENSLNRNYWQGQIDALEAVLKGFN